MPVASLDAVSLNAAFPERMEYSQDYVTKMEMRTCFNPDEEVLAAWAVRTRSYDYFESQIVHHVTSGGREVELVDGVRESTNWDAPGSKIDEFLQGAHSGTA
jgi:menaquinone-dependent protoporphyrinogen oxidase